MTDTPSSDISLQITELAVPILLRQKWIDISFPDDDEKVVLEKLNSNLQTALDLAASTRVKQLKITAPVTWKSLDKAGFVPAIYYMSIDTDKLPLTADTDSDITSSTDPTSVSSLISAQFTYHATADPGYYSGTADSVEAFMKQAADSISLGNGFLLIASVKDVPVGFLYAEHELDGGTLDELFVEEQYRGKGYGTALLSAARYHFQESGSQKVQVYVSYKTPAVDFYDNRQFSKDAIQWVKNLD